LGGGGVNFPLGKKSSGNGTEKGEILLPKKKGPVICSKGSSSSSIAEDNPRKEEEKRHRSANKGRLISSRGKKRGGVGEAANWERKDGSPGSDLR